MPENIKTYFGIDGIEFKEEMGIEEFHKKKNEFLKRIINDIT